MSVKPIPPALAHRRRWELALTLEDTDQPILGKGAQWAVAAERNVTFTITCAGTEVLRLTGGRIALVHPDIVRLDEDLRRIPLLDARSAPGDVQAMLDDPATRCFVAGCDYDDIDQRGPVFVRPFDVALPACTPHWEAIFSILGRQAELDHESSRPGPDAMHFVPQEEAP